jgi:hypothetical protein
MWCRLIPFNCNVCGRGNAIMGSVCADHACMAECMAVVSFILIIDVNGVLAGIGHAGG